MAYKEPVKGTLLSYRNDIKVLDATVRDGGLVNNFFFTDQFVRDLYETNLKAGVDYMELGYLADKELFDPEKFGKWKFCEEEAIRGVIPANDTNMKLAVMADVGRSNVKRDLPNKKDSILDMVRIATYINTIPTAIEMVEECAAKGYETTVNIMAISKAKESEIDEALALLGKSSANVIYLVDSYGSMYPLETRRLTDKYLSAAAKYGKEIGIHAHNNQQLALLRICKEKYYKRVLAKKNPHLPIPQRLLCWASIIWMQPWAVWDEVLATVRWNCCLAF